MLKVVLTVPVRLAVPQDDVDGEADELTLKVPVPEGLPEDDTDSDPVRLPEVLPDTV